MKTTIEIPDALYPKIAAASAAAGISLDAFVVHSAGKQIETNKPAESKSVPDDGIPEAPPGLSFTEEMQWRRENTPANTRGMEAVFGKGDSEEIARIQKVIDEEFGQIEPEDWE